MSASRALLATAVVVAAIVAVVVPVGDVAAETGVQSDDSFAVVPDGVSIETNSTDARAVETAVAAELDVRPADVRVADGVIEVTARNVTTEAFAAALDTAGVDADATAIRERVSATTLEETERVLTERYEQRGIDATVTVESGYLLVDTAGNADKARRLATATRTEMQATVPADDGTRTETVLESDGIAEVGTAQTARGGQPFVPVVLTEAAAEDFSAAMVEFGFTGGDGTDCEYDLESPPSDPGRCLLTVVDGEVVFAAGLSPGLGRTIATGDFVDNPRFRVTAETMTETRDLETYLRSGPLPSSIRVAPPEVLATDGTSGAGSDANGAADSETAATTNADGTGPTPLAAVLVVTSVLLAVRYR